MAYKNLRETCFFKTGREGVVLEFLDEMYPNLFDFNNDINNDILKKYSKFKVTLVDSRKTSGTGNAIFYNLSPDEVLILSYVLSDGNGSSFKKRVGAFNGLAQTEQIFLRNLVFSFDRIDIGRFDRFMNYETSKESTSITFQKNINTNGDDLLIRKFTLSYEEAMRSASKWKITIEEGTGKKDTTKGNGLNIVKSGSFKSTNKSFLMLQVEEVVIGINEAASRVMIAKQGFYPMMKTAEVEFTAKKLQAKDYTGEKIDEWNPEGKVAIRNKPLNNKSPEVLSEKVENENTKIEDSKAIEIKKDGCSGCGTDIADNVKNYSLKQFKRPLCFSCQKIEKEKVG